MNKRVVLSALGTLLLIFAAGCDFPAAAGSQLWPAGMSAGVGDGRPKDVTPYLPVANPT